MFAYGVTVDRVMRGSIVEALIIGALGTAVGIAVGRGVMHWIVATNMATPSCPRPPRVSSRSRAWPRARSPRRSERVPQSPRRPASLPRHSIAIDRVAI